MEKLVPFLHSNMFVAVVAIVLIWTVSYIFPITMATEKVSACNAVTHDCLFQCHCEKIAEVLIMMILFNSGCLFQNRNRTRDYIVSWNRRHNP